MSFPFPVLMSVLAMASGGAVLVQGLIWQPAVPQAQISEPATQTVGSQRHDLPDRTGMDVEILLERPLFTPGRHPITPAVLEKDAGEQIVETDTPVPEVAGVALSSLRSVVVVKDTDGAKIHRLPQGGSIKGWRVVAIEREKVTFTSKTMRAVVFLKSSGQQQTEVTPLVSEIADRDSQILPTKLQPES